MTYTNGSNTLLVKKSADANSVKIKISDGTVVEYFQGAYGIDNTLYAIVGAPATIDAANYSGYTKLDVSKIPYTDTLIKGFTEITSFNPSYHKLGGVPTDARRGDSDLVVTVDNKAVTVKGAANSTVSLTGDNKDYTAAIGEITNVTDHKVTLTSNFAANSYSAATDIVEVNATNINKAVNLDGSKTTNVTLLGGARNDTLWGGTGNDSLDGGTGNDLVNLNGGTATVNVSQGDDTIAVGSGVTNFEVVGFGEGDVIQLDNSFSGNLSIVDGKLKVDDKLTITGINSIAENIYSWNEGTKLAYQVKTLSGVTLNGNQIILDSTTKPLSTCLP